MLDHEEETKLESVVDKTDEKLHTQDSSSDSEEYEEDGSEQVRSEVFRLFGREKPVHQVFGGGKPADVLLWRNKKISAGVLGGVTIIWFLFEVLEYNLITLVCHGLILSLAVSFLWSNASTFIKKSPPKLPELYIPEEPTMQIAAALGSEINRVFVILKEIVLGGDLMKFLSVIAGLWFVSIIGSCCNFLTLFYIAFVLLHTIPVLYEKYEDQVDSFAEKAAMEIKKQYVVFDDKVLSKIPMGLSKDKKRA